MSTTHSNHQLGHCANAKNFPEHVTTEWYHFHQIPPTHNQVHIQILRKRKFPGIGVTTNLPIMRYPLLIEQTGPEFGTTETNIAVIILVVAVITVVVVGVVAAEVEA